MQINATQYKRTTLRLFNKVFISDIFIFSGSLHFCNIISPLSTVTRINQNIAYTHKCTLHYANSAQSTHNMAKCATVKGTMFLLLKVLRMA